MRLVGLVMGGVWGGAEQGVQVELLEDEVARVVPLGGGEAWTVPRARLPPGAREGDVVREGRLDAEERARLVREVAEARARLSVRAPNRPGLDGGAPGSLTDREEY